MLRAPDTGLLEEQSLSVARPVEGQPDCNPEERTDAMLVEADMLIEDISIDGMCGVY